MSCGGVVTFNGGAVSLPTGYGNQAWVTAANTSNGSTDSFTMETTTAGASDEVAVFAVEVDGVVLVDGHTKLLCCQSNDFAGEVTTSPNINCTVNSGTVWSSYVTGSTDNIYSGSQGPQEGFDGDTSTYVQQVGGVNPNYLTFTPPSGISHSSKVEVWLVNAANEVSYNGLSLIHI